MSDEADFRDRIRVSFARQKAMTTIGAEITRVEHGSRFKPVSMRASSFWKIRLAHRCLNQAAA